jgi:hypothetical protein
MDTRLRLLMPDGAFELCFVPKLTPRQYDELLRACKLADTREALRAALVDGLILQAVLPRDASGTPQGEESTV